MSGTNKLLRMMLAALLSIGSLAACGTETVPSTTETVSSTEETGMNLCLTGEEHRYSIVYDADLGKKVASACEELNQYLGGNLAVVVDEEKSDSSAFGEYEILVGMTNRPESAMAGEALGMFDYHIMVEGKKLVIAGGSEEALINAIAHLLRSDEFGAEIPGYYEVYFDGADNREEYIANPDLFLCNWALKFDPPEWMLDFEEKIAAFSDTDGRMMSSIHRGDGINYPENSIEGIISAVKMGVDNIEIDVRLTQDGVAVLMHNEVLSTTTDWSEKAGKNGLPASEKIYDWTYEELLELRLNAKSGDEHEYMIPTLEEVLQVCNGRTTVRLDKFGVWDWDEDIYPLIKETGAWRCCIINEDFSLEKQKEIVDTIRADSGETALMFCVLLQENPQDWTVRLEKVKTAGYYPLAIWRGIKVRGLESQVADVESALNEVKGNYRIYMFAHLLNGGTEKPEQWDYLYENGVNFVIADNGLKLQQYIADNFEAAEH